MFPFLFDNKRRVISKSAIAEHLTCDMADMMDNFNFVSAHRNNLKKRLAAAELTDHIKTLYEPAINKSFATFAANKHPNP